MSNMEYAAFLNGLSKSCNYSFYSSIFFEGDKPIFNCITVESKGVGFIISKDADLHIDLIMRCENDF